MMSDEDPAVWGPQFWNVMRKIAAQYPSSEPSASTRQAAKEFYQSLRELLPCQKCREHYQEFLEKHPLTDEVLGNSKSLSEWVETIKKEVDAVSEKKLSVAESAVLARNLRKQRFLTSGRRPQPPGRANMASQVAGATAYQHAKRSIRTAPQPTPAPTNRSVIPQRRAIARHTLPVRRAPIPRRKGGCSTCGQRR